MHCSPGFLGCGGLSRLIGRSRDSDCNELILDINGRFVPLANLVIINEIYWGACVSDVNIISTAVAPPAGNFGGDN
jgi:hypothetical protein